MTTRATIPGSEFVDELLAQGGYEKVHQALSMIVLRKRDLGPADARAARAASQDSQPVTAVIAARPSLAAREPLISCIMPTADRRAFVPQSIRYFLRQDYARRELIILDDGVDCIADLIPSDERIRYLRMDEKRSMGTKHNLACDMARGDIILHWDDDDWMADWRLSYQLESLRFEPRNTLSGLSCLLFYEPRSGGVWEYSYADTTRPWVVGSTFCYHREFSEQHRFPDMNEGADTVFVWGLEGAKVLRLRGMTSSSASSTLPTGARSRRAMLGGSRSRRRIRALLKADWSFYRSLAKATA